MPRGIDDGPIDPALYGVAITKVLHLLKNPSEDYGPDNGFSLPRFFQALIAEDRGSELMWRLAQRSICIHRGKCTWRELGHIPKQEVWIALRKSAVVNIANDEFSRSASEELVYQWADAKFDRWHEKLLGLKPDIVICGGTGDAVWGAFENRGNCTCHMASTGLEYFQDPVESSIRYVCLPHPLARFPQAMVFTHLSATMKELLVKQ